MLYNLPSCSIWNGFRYSGNAEKNFPVFTFFYPDTFYYTLVRTKCNAPIKMLVSFFPPQTLSRLSLLHVCNISRVSYYYSQLPQVILILILNTTLLIINSIISPVRSYYDARPFASTSSSNLSFMNIKIGNFIYKF